MTKKMSALFAIHPPKRPLDSLSAIVDDWIFRFGAKGVQKERRDLVVEYTAQARSWVQAVNRATASRDASGKMHNHQSRVPDLFRKRYAATILRIKANKAETFDELHDLCEGAAFHGIGPVTIYDVSTRLAAFLKLEIESLYLHAGVRVGWTLLHGRRMPEATRIPRRDLPAELRRIPADECEDMLCAYREYLKPWLKEAA